MPWVKSLLALLAAENIETQQIPTMKNLSIEYTLIHSGQILIIQLNLSTTATLGTESGHCGEVGV